MGVPRLFPLLKYSVSRVRFFDLFAGKLVAVDAFVWLHELVSKHARSVLIKNDLRCVVRDFIGRVQSGLRRGVTFYLVFDGKRHDAKHGTGKVRRERRMKALLAEVEELPETNDDDSEISDAVLKVAAGVSEVRARAL